MVQKNNKYLSKEKNEISIKLNITFKDAMKNALSTPLKDSKVNQDIYKTKKAKKKS